jgi:hypothetical protein
MSRATLAARRLKLLGRTSSATTQARILWSGSACTTDLSSPYADSQGPVNIVSIKIAVGDGILFTHVEAYPKACRKGRGRLGDDAAKCDQSKEIE